MISTRLEVSQYLVHEGQRLLGIFLFLFGQILQHLLQLLPVALHLTFIIWNNSRRVRFSSPVTVTTVFFFAPSPHV